MTVAYIRREDPADGIARVVLARPGKRNAQNPDLLYELDAALLAAATDATVRVIILAADGPDFSSGHDLKAAFAVPGAPVATMGGHLDAGLAEGHYAFECDAYLGLSRRWRDLPKPTIAAAHGRSIAGALMLLWPMDIIVAAEDATFSDPVTAFGVNGVEYFTHVWELGHRKARELLYTGEAITASEAHRLGMVNHVVPKEELDGFVLDLARRIATRPPFGLRLAKESVNRTLDAQGQSIALDSALSLHNLGHAANLARTGSLIVTPDLDARPVSGPAHPAGRGWSPSDVRRALRPDLHITAHDADHLAATVRFSDVHLGDDGAANGAAITLVVEDVVRLLSATGRQPVRTASLRAEFRATAPIGPELEVRGWLERAESGQRRVRVTVHYGDSVCAEAEALVESQSRPGRPRRR